MTPLRVYGVAGRAVPLRNGIGAPIMGRFVGLNPDGSPVPEGVDRPDTPDLWAALHRGDLTLTPPGAAPPPPPPAADPAPAAEAAPATPTPASRRRTEDR